ncbi:MAG: hypothetical protein EXS18_05495 [Verrucomicrobiae bacterium]|nr:hypothetical protein [Verrucomicrobiae bacterium]
MSKRIDWWDVLDLFCWGLETISRPTLHRTLYGYDADRYRTIDPSFWRRMEKERWVARTGRGANAKFTITPTGRKRCADTNPRASWDRVWDRKWRLVTFDVPEVRNHDRVTLWRQLRARNMGLLQQSVWVWPHGVETILEEVIQAIGIPECFAGFECTRIFLCTDEEIVRVSWDFAAIDRAHQGYLKKADGFLRAIRNAANETVLARVVREERWAYRDALSADPLLPRQLWPGTYRGSAVCEHHEAIRAELRRCFARLLPNESV